MNAKALVLVSLATAGCSSVQEDRTRFRCEAAVRRIFPGEWRGQSKESQGPPLYFVEFRVDRIDAEGAVVQEIARPTATVVEDQRCVMMVGGVDPLGAAVGSVSDGCEAVILVPNESISKEALLQFRVKKDNLTLWSQDQKVLVAGRLPSRTSEKS